MSNSNGGDVFKRGFKTWCENTAAFYRRTMGLKKQDPLDPFALAKHLTIKIITPLDITDLSEHNKKILLQSEASSWSAATLSINNSVIIIYNSSHSPARQSNDIMHELSHIIAGHTPQIMHSYEMGVFLRMYDENQEAEADWLAATLLLSRDVLIAIKYSNISLEDSAKKYFVSKQLLNMRLNISGVNQIYTRSSNRLNKVKK